jgi:WD40 repeat protein/transcriptional regulator with XRE-family HTH domain
MPAQSFSPSSFTTFGDLLKYLRRRERLTQLELSIAVGYSEAQIGRLEKNQRHPDLTAIKALFIPALHLENEPELTGRFLELAESARQEDAPAPGIAPYKGLLFFDEPDADLFFGRDAATALLTGHVMDLTTDSSSRFLAVVGASGSGKSSLVRAGLAVALKRAGWDTRVFTPTANPLKILSANMNALRGKSSERALLLVDQSEEVFTLCHDETERITFIEKLLSSAQDKSRKTTVVIALRADFYQHLAQYPLLRQAVAAEQEYIGHMTADELRRAIEEPARHGVWEFEPGLVDILLQDIGAHRSQEPGALPLLSHALLATWERRQGRTFTLAGYYASGGIQGAIAETAESVFADQLNQDQQKLAHDVFLRLTELGEGTEDTRRRASLNELVRQAGTGEAAQLRTVLNILAEARLVTLNEDNAEVAHEALIREWQRLRDWLNEDREGLKLHRHLTETVHEWESHGRDVSELYRGARLAHAREWMEAYGDRLNQSEREFLAASVEHEQYEALEREAQRQRELEAAHRLAETEKARAQEQAHSIQQLRRRAVYLVAVLAIAVIAAIVAGIFAKQNGTLASTNASVAAMAQAEAAARATQQSIAEANLTRSEAQRLAAEANSLMQSGVADPQLIALLSLRSISTQYTPQGDAALTGAAALPLPRQIFSGHTEGLLSVAFSPDGRYILTGSRDDTAILWDAQTGQELRQFAGHLPGPRDGGVGAGVRAIFSPDGKYVLTGGFDGVAKLWDVETGEELRAFSGHSDAVWGIAFSPDGKYVLTGSFDHTARLWDPNTGKEIRQFRGHTEEVCEVAFSPDGQYIVTGSYDNTARLWDVGTGKEVRVFRGHTHHVVSVTFSPDGRYIVTGSWDNTARLWNVETGKELHQFTGHTNWINSVAFSPDGRFLLTGSGDKIAILWDVQTGRELHQFSGHPDSIESVVFSSDGHYILTGSGDKMAWMWDLQQASGEHPSFIGHTNAVYGIAFSPDGQYIATGSADNTARLWDAKTGEELRQFIGHTDWINSVAFSPNGRYIFTGSLDGTARLWDIQTGKELRTFTGHTDGLSTVAFSPDGKYVLTGSWDRTARRWETQTGKIVTIYQVGDGPYGVAFSPDGQYVLTGDFSTHILSLWDAQSGKRLRQFTGHTEPVNGVAFSPDGRFVLGSSYDKTARLWDVQTGEQLQVFTGHTAFLWTATFSPDGKFVLTAGGDNTARLWDVQTGEELRRFTGHTGPVEWVVFSPDGKTFATASDDGTARRWDVDFRDTIQYLCSSLLRDFTDEERTQYDITDNTPTCPKS